MFSLSLSLSTTMTPFDRATLASAAKCIIEGGVYCHCVYMAMWNNHVTPFSRLMAISHTPTLIYLELLNSKQDVLPRSSRTRSSSVMENKVSLSKKEEETGRSLKLTAVRIATSHPLILSQSYNTLLGERWLWNSWLGFSQNYRFNQTIGKWQFWVQPIHNKPDRSW